MEAQMDEVEEITLVDPKESKNTKPLKEIAPVSIPLAYPDHHVMIGTKLTTELRIIFGRIFEEKL